MEQPKLFDDQEQLNLPAHLMEYLPRFYGKEESNHLLECLIRQVPWQQHKVKMYDKEVLTPRLNAWLAERPLLSVTFRMNPATPPAVGLPVIDPAASSFRPTGSLPVTRLHL